MKKGGYQIIDLKDNNITTDGVIISGIHDIIEANKRKVILISGVTINGVEFSDMFVKVVKVGNDYRLNAYNVAVDNALSSYDLFVEEDDTVTLIANTLDTDDYIENPMTTAFDMIVGGTDGEPDRLEAGNVGEVLTMGQSGVEWAEPTEGMTNPMVSPKDIIVGGSMGVPTRLATGSTGQVLTVADAGLEWATPASGGVSSLGGATGAITLGSGLSITGNELSASGGGGGGVSIGGAGYTITHTDFGISGGAYTALILGLYNGVYGWHVVDYNGDGDSFIDGVLTTGDAGYLGYEMTNCSIIIFTFFNGNDVLEFTTSALKLYDGTAINASSSVSANVNKIMYLVNNFTIAYQD